MLRWLTAARHNNTKGLATVSERLWLRLSTLLVCLLPFSAYAGVVDLLGAEIAGDVATQIARTRREASACVYVDDSLSPNPSAPALANAIAASLSSAIGVSDIADVGLSTLSEASATGASVGCGFVIVVAFESPAKTARSRVWLLQPSYSPRSLANNTLSTRALGEPFLSSIVALPPSIAKPPADLSKGWRMQQITMGNEPILALLVDHVGGSSPSPAMFALTRYTAIAYRFDPRAKSSSPFSPPKEIARAELSSLNKETKVSRDPTGVLVLDRALCTGECRGSKRYLLLRTSFMASTYKLPLDDSFATAQKLSEDDDLNQRWPLLITEEQKLLFGDLEDGTNLFTKKLWWVSSDELDKKSITKSELSATDRFFAASYAPQDKEHRLAFVQESEELALFQGPQLISAGSLGRSGAQLLWVDLEQDKRPELLTTSNDAAGEGDVITLSSLEEKAPKKLWSSGTLYAPASVSAGKGRALSWVTALAAGDLDGDGSIEIIAALYSSAGSSILIISR